MSQGQEQLEEALERFKRVPFPRDSADDQVSELHAELAEYDGYVAGLVSKITKGHSVDPQLLNPDPALRARIAEAASSGRSDAGRAGEYLAYVDQLERLLALARRAVVGG